MDRDSPARPARRRAHVCRVCDSAFTCKAELLEHEQEAHAASSVSTPLSKRKPDSAGPSSILLQTPAARSNVLHVSLVAANLLVDHEEVYESRSRIRSGVVAVQKTAAVAMQPVVAPAAAANATAHGSVGTGGAVKQASVVSTENQQPSSSYAAAATQEQQGNQSAEGTSQMVSATRVVSQSTGSPSQQPNLGAEATAVQNRGPLTVTVSSSPTQQSDQGARATVVQNADPVPVAALNAVSSAVMIKSTEGSVIQALGLQRKGSEAEATTASNALPGADVHDTKPPVSEDITGSAVDSRQLTKYQVLGTINTEPRTGSDGAVRTSRDVGIQVSPTLPTMTLPAMTKEEATDCVAALHQGQSYAAPVNNDELQLLAAVSSTRSRDIVTQPEKVSSLVPAPEQPEEPQEMTDVAVTDIVEQEVELETTAMACDSIPKRKRFSSSRLPANLYELPMTPHEFTSSDGAKKRMVALTVAPRAPRMVSVLLRNRGTASGTDEKQEQQESAAEANVEQQSDQQTKEEGEEANTNAETATDTVVERESANSMAAEAVTAAQALALENVADDISKKDASNQVVQLMMEQCLYCQQPFPSHELADHITLNHVCNQCGRKFRQPANLLKVRVNHYDFMSVYWHMHNLLLIKLELWKSMINCVINDFRIVYCYGFTN